MKTSRRLLSAMTLVLAAAIVAAPARAQGVDPGGPPLEFTEGQFCIWSGPDDLLLADALGNCNAALNRVEVGTVVYVGGLNLDLSSYTSVYNDFWVNGDSGTSLDAFVTADVDWHGVLFGAGVLGAGASVKIEMLLWDQNTGAITGSKTILSKAQDSTGLKGIDVGGTVVRGSDHFSFPAKVVRGHLYSLELRLTCQSESGLFGADIGCLFIPDSFGLGLSGDYHAKWTSLSISVAQDINDRFDALEEKLDALDAKLDEVLRLLHTPQGLRETDVPACEGLACNFPQNPRRR